MARKIPKLEVGARCGVIADTGAFFLFASGIVWDCQRGEYANGDEMAS
jgi:hypothetical protein